MYRLVLLAAMCLLFFGISVERVGAHTLGVDRGDLTETSPGVYRLTSRVPARIAPAILSPILPETCQFAGNPNGERGGYAVTFNFTCDQGLTAQDRIVLPWKREGTLLKVTWYGEEPVTRLAQREGDTITLDLAEWRAGSGSTLRAAQRYTVLGIGHILTGLDHLLFVLALLFVVQGPWKLVKTITAFTVAHSITLGAATLGYVNLASAPVEAAIALSIVFLASEIIGKSRGGTSITFEAPWIVAFAFGLLHGLGFAGALTEIGLPPSEIPIALLFFNVGVEIGQLLFVMAILGLSFFVSRLGLPALYTRGVKLVCVYSIGTLAMFWTVERTIQVFS